MNSKDDKVDRFLNKAIKNIFLSVVTLLVCLFVISRYGLADLPATKYEGYCEVKE